jgi:hypothetical protein
MLPFDIYYYGSTPPAYIDPGTGSLIIQVLIGALVGGLVAVKVFWSRIKTFFKGLFSTGSKQRKDDN